MWVLIKYCLASGGTVLSADWVLGKVPTPSGSEINHVECIGGLASFVNCNNRV